MFYFKKNKNGKRKKKLIDTFWNSMLKKEYMITKKTLAILSNISIFSLGDFKI